MIEQQVQFNFDEDRGVVQKDGDAGDRPARTGLYHLLIWYRRHRLQMAELAGQWLHSTAEDFKYFLSQSRTPLGEYFRGGTYREPKDMSRDQFWALIAACAVYGLHSNIRLIVKQFTRNYLRAPNGDLIGPDMWAMIFRCLGLHYLYPLMLILDLEHLLNTLFICFVKARTPGKFQQWLGKNVHWIFIAGEKPREDGWINDKYGPDNVGGDINHIVSYLVGKIWFRSPVLWLSWKLYTKFRPNGVQYAWDHYFRPETGGNPFNEIVRPIIK